MDEYPDLVPNGIDPFDAPSRSFATLRLYADSKFAPPSATRIGYSVMAAAAVSSPFVMQVPLMCSTTCFIA